MFGVLAVAHGTTAAAWTSCCRRVRAGVRARAQLLHPAGARGQVPGGRRVAHAHRLRPLPQPGGVGWVDGLRVADPPNGSITTGPRHSVLSHFPTQTPTQTLLRDPSADPYSVFDENGYRLQYRLERREKSRRPPCTHRPPWATAHGTPPHSLHAYFLTKCMHAACCAVSVTICRPAVRLGGLHAAHARVGHLRQQRGGLRPRPAARQEGAPPPGAQRRGQQRGGRRVRRGTK